MKASFPALAGSFLLVPCMDAEGFLHVTRVPILGWSNFAEKPDDAPNLRTSATPLVTFWPDGVTRAAGYQIPDDQGGYSISVPFAKLAFTGANVLGQYESFATEIVERMAAEEAEEASLDPAFRGAAVDALADTRGEGVDKGIGLTLDAHHFIVSTMAEDAREHGKAGGEGSRRNSAEIENDAAYVRAVELTGKTIRAANTQWKKTPSRADVLVALGWVRDTPIDPHEEAVGTDAGQAYVDPDAPVYDDDDMDLLG